MNLVRARVRAGVLCSQVVTSASSPLAQSGSSARLSSPCYPLCNQQLRLLNGRGVTPSLTASSSPSVPISNASSLSTRLLTSTRSNNVNTNQTAFTPTSRNSFFYFRPLTTRWKDNDIYGHVNNVEYYSYFDTAVNEYFIHEGGLDIHGETDDHQVTNVMAESGCRFMKSVAYPDKLETAIRVGRLGNTSVRTEVAIFREGESSPAAVGYVVHVFTSRGTAGKVQVPERLRRALEKIIKP
eukprot:TRINITY_DN5240_c0_g1_i1.p1 TRINITY_DN5240_c0_g1~~TRINITY_DN5240_c0_g1_i1.p1  ORF type:complete len:240 (+),score=13.84 TRINITY_DN5240_c0_g1_i1:188-907(+)